MAVRVKRANFSSFIPMNTSIETLKTSLIHCIHFLHNRGFAPATSANYSCKLEGDTIFHITASGKDKGQISVDDLMLVDAEGRAIDDDRKPSAETLLHVLIYQARKDVQCILHSHSVYNTVLSEIHKKDGQLVLEGFEIMKAIPGIKTHESQVVIPVFRNSQDMELLSEEIRAYWQNHPDMSGFLLAGHGFYTWGSSIEQAKRCMEAFEFLFEVYYKIRTYR